MPLRALALSCFFLSGATGLLYQVLWARMLGGVIGNTHFSITAVVAVFMGGLALGSHLGGRAADRSKNPLRLYGILVLAVGLLCLLVPLLIILAEPLFASLYQPWEGNPEALPLLLCRLLFCVIVLLGPTTCMGATLPVLAKFLATRMSKVGMNIGGLYTVNTLGAFFGAALTGFFAIATLGLWGTTALAVAIDVVIGVVVIYAARGLDATTPAPQAEKTPEDSDAIEKTPLPFNVRLCVFCFGVTGFANMLLQISWTKALIPTIGNSTYAFSLIVTLFILGIALGGALMSWLVDRLKRPILALGLIIAVKGLLVSATIPALGRFPLWGARLFDQVDEPSYEGFLWIKLWMVACLVLPCTLLMGTVFPLVSKIRTLALDKVGDAVGSAYFSNTMGSILGTLAAGFLFVPLFGEIFHTLYISAALNLIVGLALTWVATRGFSLPRVAAAALILLSLMPLWAMRPHAWDSRSDYWHPAIMSLGAYSYYKGAYYKDRRNNVVLPMEELIDQTIRTNEIKSHKVGLHAEVTVVKHRLLGTTALRISGKADASVKPDGSYTQDLPHQVMAGHLPMTLHPDPQRVLTLGLGGGVTLGTLTTYPVRLIDNLEISKEVIEAAKKYFKKANRGALDNHPKVRNVIGDGRNHLQFTTETYDVITSVPSNPWIAGIGNLFTTEFFQICRDRLADDGIICQWIHKINLREKDLKTVVRTFTTVFDKHAQLWDLGYDCLLIGSKSSIRLDAARLQALFENPGFRSDLAGLGIVDAVSLLRHYRMDAADMNHWTGKGLLNTDSSPILEFECPKGMYGHEFDAYRNLTLAGYSSPDKSWVFALGEEKLAASRIRQEAFQHLELAKVLHKQLLDDLNRWGLSSLDKNKIASFSRDEKATMLQRAAEIITHLDKLHNSFASSTDDWLDEQGTRIGRLVTGSPGESLQDVLLGYHSGLAMNPKLQVNPLEVAGHLEKALEYSRDKPGMTRDLSIQLGRICLRLGKPKRGIAGMQRVIAQEPTNAGVVELYGVLHAAAGDQEKAEAILKRALELCGDDERTRGSVLHNLGLLFLQLGNSPRAIEYLEEALQLNPDNEPAKKILGELRARKDP